MIAKADVLLSGGPCDPLRVEMFVAPNAERIIVGPPSFGCVDVYRVSQKLLTDSGVLEATGDYLHTVGARWQILAYRTALARGGGAAAFKVKRG